MNFSIINFENKSSFLRGSPKNGPDKETLLQSTVKEKEAIVAPFQYAGRHIPEQTLLQKYLGVWTSFASVYVSSEGLLVYSKDPYNTVSALGMSDQLFNSYFLVKLQDETLQTI
jgi:hypothetical protein